MCGIVGIVGVKPVETRILKSLKLLEYRGYDSAGLAVVNDNKIDFVKVKGKINDLTSAVQKTKLKCNVGIGHTRWATHGEPSEKNAHPMVFGDIAVVHNGIIENHNEVRRKLMQKGYEFASGTDTEVIPSLIDSFLKENNTITESIRLAFQELEGAFAVGVAYAKTPCKLYCMKNGAPLAIGLGEGENYLGSDAMALSPYTNKVVYLEDGDIAEVTTSGHKIFDLDSKPIKRPVKVVSEESTELSKGNHEHFMLKEIFEQPRVLGESFRKYWDMDSEDFKVKSLDISKYKKVHVVACGTSYHAGILFKYWLEKYAGTAVEVSVASEFRYRVMPFEEDSAAIFISQSGETADTLAAMKHCKKHGLHTMAIVNVTESSMANIADTVLPIFAGYEIGVASTKAFLAQLNVLSMIALATAKSKGTLKPKELQKLVNSLEMIPEHVNDILRLSDEIKFIAKVFSYAKSMIFIGRGVSYPTAMEGALKMKELSYIHAEGIAAGELKHGPIALIDQNCPVVVVCPGDDLFGKTESNAYEIFARNGKLIVITDSKSAKEFANLSSNVIKIPKGNDFTNPVFATVVNQLLSYHTAVDLGKNVDQPRNLAKSVTVE